MAVLRKLRRNPSKDSSPSSTTNPSKSNNSIIPASRHDSIATNSSQKSGLTFFDLPAELRNEIYDLVASTTILTLPPSSNTSNRKDRSLVPVPGLLLTSRQTRREYLPLLYSTAPVAVEIRDFNFNPLLNAVANLYATELKALRLNPNLVLQLRTQNCTKDNLAGLRRWVVSRANSLDRLPWRYEVVHPEGVGMMGWWRLRKEVGFYRDRVAGLRPAVGEAGRWELEAVVEAFGRKGEELDGRLEGITVWEPRFLRGVAGGGLR
ncbi:hypothetical protein M433DRAFT_134587 [Acidomyces richmondensis BFW]|nr:MAG: hypothetical protein FE78DRAFT_31682 [Acidomyces sp. 'richmondensis']KYG45569.1 hypothetical protein M433DRAFT_134587 [Acidomyces richmondensis BFW]